MHAVLELVTPGTQVYIVYRSCASILLALECLYLALVSKQICFNFRKTQQTRFTKVMTSLLVI